MAVLCARSFVYNLAMQEYTETLVESIEQYRGMSVSRRKRDSDENGKSGECTR